MPPQEEDFYRGQYFDEMSKRFTSIERTLEEQSKDLSDIKSQMKWVFGLVAGVTVIVNIVWTFIRDISKR